ncbi:hypothetical protein OAD66_08720 [Bacteroidia bacterium]|nr:hypothetical protein [Bacteroidia bacterium]MDB9883199.1 hypothetical protein [Bacteroidia bacterium]
MALGSFSTYLFFSKIYKANPNYLIALGLALGVWFIYTLDHLLDGVTLKERAVSIRHKEHFDNKKALKTLLVLVAFVLLTIAFLIPQEYYRFIGVLVLLTGLHFAMNYLVSESVKRRIFLKEVFIAFVVTLGFAYTPFLELEDKYTFGLIGNYLVFIFFINLANLILFSLFDKDADKLSSTLSIARFYSNRTLQFFIALSLLISLGYALVLYLGCSCISTVAFTVILCMQLTLFVISQFPAYFRINDRFRFYGDLIYLYPLFALPFL